MHKILIVDDHADIRDLLRMTLDLAQSFDIHEAKNGQEAVDIAATLKPDLVLMDIMMPGPFDGIEACRRIKAQGGAAIKVILVSAKPAEEIRQAVKEAGADLFMSKPFGPLQLVDSITALYAPKAGASTLGAG
ncbi:response regulator transcription factor [Paucibacter sp. APW11]|uniref:Response regulator transcription factor n=1 Tax=Roseateles aquae TaxID=3077235 RepID=A0ABU3PFU3_9BURK|nr:response regulator transcription factor [Paucibacter sp. APW11]MDT9000781.1 response regulator transcription factor [Paucibacter sp. APW11]